MGGVEVVGVNFVGLEVRVEVLRMICGLRRWSLLISWLICFWVLIN